MQVIANKEKQMKHETVTVAVRVSKSDYNRLIAKIGEPGMNRLSDVVRWTMAGRLWELEQAEIEAARKEALKMKRLAKKLILDVPN